MLVWNPNDPHDWGRLAGMVSVPMFGSGRAKTVRGHGHAILLDGERSSFALSFGDASELLAMTGPISWAWSANVNHSLIYDERDQHLIHRRWDKPTEIRYERNPSAGSILKLIDDFDREQVPQDRTAIERTLRVFRIVRESIDKEGGRSFDVMAAFTALLAFATSLRSSESRRQDFHGLTLQGVIGQLPMESRGLIEVTPRIENFPLGEFAIPLLEGEQSGEYLLDPEVLVRHASGTLFQEAHIELAEREYVQKSLFVVPSLDAPPARGEPKHDAYFTPPSLARLLVEQALTEFRRLNGNTQQISALDPACGSGVFLIEAYREARSHGMSVSLRGNDNSRIACLMTEFSLRHTTADDEASTTFEIAGEDSLALESWGDPDLIVMNPPFTSWGDMTAEERAIVKETLGDGRYYGRADKSAAFIAKAIDNLKPGAVLASLVPQSFLTSRFALRLREYIASRTDLNLCLVGEISGYGYFHGPTVEPAFLVLSRSIEPSPRETIQLIATDEDADRIIRALRRGAFEGYAESNLRSVSLLNETDWRPRHSEQTTLRDRLAALDVARLASLFRVYEGIRTGHNPAFIVTAAQLDELGIPRGHAAFRPVASNSTIRVGRLVPTQYVFYPYTEDDKPLFHSADELRAELPTYFDTTLFPQKPELEKRSGVPGDWWTLTRHRSWQPKILPRLLSTVFGDPGSFTFDATGRFAIVQAFYWKWRDGDAEFVSSRLPLAYVALLNSTVFSTVCQIQTRQMQGGQLDLYPNHTKDVFLPDLSRAKQRISGRLAEYGESILEGEFPSLESLDETVAAAYGLPHQSFLDAAQTGDPAEDFARLAREWYRDTRHLSNSKHILAHPSLQQIMRMGSEALPLIEEELRLGKTRWIQALPELTGENPVRRESRGKVEELLQDWLQWFNNRT